MDIRDLREDEKAIRVYVRVRPPLQREIERNFRDVVKVNDDHSVSVLAAPKAHLFHFDFVGDTQTTQQEMFERVGRPITDRCVAGYNGTIFAYGQTGSGKTFTIQGGSDGASQISSRFLTANADTRGLMPRVFEYLFEQIRRAEIASGHTVKYLCQASFLEIYNDKIYDLMVTNGEALTIREHANKSVAVEGLMEVSINEAADALRVLDVGARNRTVGETAMNRESSRSHSVFCLTITSSHTDRETGVTNNRTSQFNLVDLAGSERQTSANTMGVRLSEASGINQSLSTLGNVIVSLADISHGRKRHVPYRDSKLTFFLRDSLGGNSLTYIIACISPSQESIGETVSTLSFAQRAKRVKNRAVINENMNGTLEALQKENMRLKQLLKSLQSGLNGTINVESVIQQITNLDNTMGGAVVTPSSVPLSTADQQDVVTFDLELFRQALARETEVRAELDRTQSELQQVKLLNDKLNAQRQSRSMILNFREQTIRQLEDTVSKLRKKDLTPPTANEKALAAELSRAREELVQRTEMLNHHPDILAQMMRVRSLELQLKDLAGDIDEMETVHAKTVSELEAITLERDELKKQLGLTAVPSTPKLPEPNGMMNPFEATVTLPITKSTSMSTMARHVPSLSRSVSVTSASTLPMPISKPSTSPSAQRISSSPISPLPIQLPPRQLSSSATSSPNPELKVDSKTPARPKTKTRSLSEQINELKVPYLRERLRIVCLLRELQAFNFKASVEIQQLRESGHRTPADEQEQQALGVEKKMIEERLASVERTLEEERKKAEEEKARLVQPTVVVAPVEPSVITKQLEESKNLARVLKTYLEKAVEREQQAKAMNSDLTAKLSRETILHQKEVESMLEKEKELTETIQTLSTMLMKQEAQITRLMNKHARAVESSRPSNQRSKSMIDPQLQLRDKLARLADAPFDDEEEDEEDANDTPRSDYTSITSTSETSISTLRSRGLTSYDDESDVLFETLRSRSSDRDSRDKENDDQSVRSNDQSVRSNDQSVRSNGRRNREHDRPQLSPHRSLSDDKEDAAQARARRDMAAAAILSVSVSSAGRRPNPTSPSSRKQPPSPSSASLIPNRAVSSSTLVVAPDTSTRQDTLQVQVGKPPTREDSPNSAPSASPHPTRLPAKRNSLRPSAVTSATVGSPSVSPSGASGAGSGSGSSANSGPNSTQNSPLPSRSPSDVALPQPLNRSSSSTSLGKMSKTLPRSLRAPQVQIEDL